VAIRQHLQTLLSAVLYGEQYLPDCADVLSTRQARMARSAISDGRYVLGIVAIVLWRWTVPSVEVEIAMVVMRT